MKVIMLGSGSKGNCTFIQSKNTKILIDAGFSCKNIEEKLNKMNDTLSNISAIFVTHEHIDHIAGAGIISRKYNIPIYITEESYSQCSCKIGDVKDENIKFIKKDIFVGKDLMLSSFDVPHDATRTIGFRIESSERKSIAIATDIGQITPIVKDRFRNVDMFIIESNYNFNMLMTCSYPIDLKNRIKSRYGHLKNDDAAKFILEMNNPRLKNVILAHVSQDSNTYELAKSTTYDLLDEEKIKLKINVAKQNEITKIEEI